LREGQTRLEGQLERGTDKLEGRLERGTDLRVDLSDLRDLREGQT
jgi:hypothetical protein